MRCLSIPGLVALAERVALSASRGQANSGGIAQAGAQEASNTEAAQTIVLNRYGFNDKDSKEILFQVSKSRFTCENAIVRQCDLITLRNGVGY